MEISGGLLVTSPVMRVQFQSVGVVFFTVRWLLEIKALGQVKPQTYTEREKLYKEQLEAALNLIKYFLGTNITGQPWV